MKKLALALALSLSTSNTFQINFETIKKNTPIVLIGAAALYTVFKTFQPIETVDFIKDTSKKVSAIKSKIGSLAESSSNNIEETLKALNENGAINAEVVLKQLKDNVKAIKENNSTLRTRLASMMPDEMDAALKSIEESRKVVINTEIVIKQLKDNFKKFSKELNKNIIEKKYRHAMSASSDEELLNRIKELSYDLFPGKKDSLLKMEKELSKDINKTESVKIKTLLTKMKSLLIKTYAYKKQEESKVLEEIKREQSK